MQISRYNFKIKTEKQIKIRNWNQFLATKIPPPKTKVLKENSNRLLTRLSKSRLIIFHSGFWIIDVHPTRRRPGEKADD